MLIIMSGAPAGVLSDSDEIPFKPWLLPETKENYGAITWVGKRLNFVINQVDDTRLVTVDVAPRNWQGTFTWFGNLNAMHACRRECRAYDFEAVPGEAPAPDTEFLGLIYENTAYDAERVEFECLVTCYSWDMEGKLDNIKSKYVGKTFDEVQPDK